MLLINPFIFGLKLDLSGTDFLFNLCKEMEEGDITSKHLTVYFLAILGSFGLRRPLKLFEVVSFFLSG